MVLPRQEKHPLSIIPILPAAVLLLATQIGDQMRDCIKRCTKEKRAVVQNRSEMPLRAIYRTNTQIEALKKRLDLFQKQQHGLHDSKMNDHWL